MGDPLSIVASIISIADVGIKLGSNLYAYSSNARHAESQVRDIAREMKATSSVLRELGQVLESDQKIKLCSANALATTKDALQECNDVFGEIDRALKKHQKGAGKIFLPNLTWPLKKEKMELLRSNLEKLKSTLSLMMQVLSYARVIACEKPDSAHTDHLQQRIAELARANEESIKKYELLKNQMQHSVAQADSSINDIDGMRDRPQSEQSCSTSSSFITMPVIMEPTVNVAPSSTLDPPFGQRGAIETCADTGTRSSSDCLSWQDLEMCRTLIGDLLGHILRAQEMIYHQGCRQGHPRLSIERAYTSIRNGLDNVITGKRVTNIATSQIRPRPSPKSIQKIAMPQPPPNAYVPQIGYTSEEETSSNPPTRRPTRYGAPPQQQQQHLHRHYIATTPVQQHRADSPRPRNDNNVDTPPDIVTEDNGSCGHGFNEVQCPPSTGQSANYATSPSAPLLIGRSLSSSDDQRPNVDYSRSRRSRQSFETYPNGYNGTIFNPGQTLHHHYCSDLNISLRSESVIPGLAHSVAQPQRYPSPLKGCTTENKSYRHYIEKHNSALHGYECTYEDYQYKSNKESECKQHMETTHGSVYIRHKTNGRHKASASRTPETPALLTHISARPPYQPHSSATTNGKSSDFFGITLSDELSCDHSHDQKLDIDGFDGFGGFPNQLEDGRFSTSGTEISISRYAKPTHPASFQQSQLESRHPGVWECSSGLRTTNQQSTANSTPGQLPLEGTKSQRDILNMGWKRGPEESIDNMPPSKVHRTGTSLSVHTAQPDSGVPAVPPLDEQMDLVQSDIVLSLLSKWTTLRESIVTLDHVGLPA